MTKQIAEVLLKLPEYFVPEKAKGIDTTVQLQIIDKINEYWLVTIKNQLCKVEKKEDPAAKMKLTAKSNLILNILDGSQDLIPAYMRGEIAFEGNVFYAMKFLNFFDLPDNLSKKIPFV